VATYAIGDIQGCYAELLDLLTAIEFDPAADTLWFTGDLVNRGPQSLEVLRFVKALGERAIVVLGNHDLHLLAIACTQNARAHREDTLSAVLAAPDKADLIEWLRHRPLFHHDAELGYAMVHAGLAPQWDAALTKAIAHEFETALRRPAFTEFLSRMYGNQPDRWSDDLDGWDRLRVITNYCTRMRYCDAEGRMCLAAKGPPGTQPAPYVPWYAIPARRTRGTPVIFGHWSTLRLTREQMCAFNVYALDTGCLWGGALSALNLSTATITQVPAGPSAIKPDRQPAVEY
jgi:bis(5'-nucleosyl)-tetraphosphatase (symmetrical)